MNNRIDKDTLLEELSGWNSFLKRRVHLIACGGTALTLLGVKPSTKDIDLLVTEIREFDYLTKTLKDLGYHPVTGWGLSRGNGYVFDLFRGKCVHTTELLDSPLAEGENIKFREFSMIYLGILNYYDILISKLFRCTSVDIEDCLLLVKAKRSAIDIEIFIERFKETASFDISEDKVIKNLEHFLKILRREKIYESKCA